MSTRIKDTHETRTLYSREKEYSDESLFLNFLPGGAIQIESRFSQTTFGEGGPWITDTDLYLIDAGNVLRLHRALVGDVIPIDERDRRNRIFAAMEKKLGANAKIGEWLTSLGVPFTKEATRSKPSFSEDDEMDAMHDIAADSVWFRS